MNCQTYKLVSSSTTERNDTNCPDSPDSYRDRDRDWDWDRDGFSFSIGLYQLIIKLINKNEC